MSIHVYRAPFMLITLFQSTFDVIKAAPRVVNSSVYIMRLPPAVILTLFGLLFCGRKSTTTLAYVTVRSFGILLISSSIITKIVFVPISPVLSSP